MNKLFPYPEFEIRDAIQNDLEKIVAIYNSTVAGRMVTADTEPVSIESRLNWFKEHNPAKRPLWVIENADQDIIGWVSFQSFYGRPAYDATAEISIYLHESVRGKGLGKRLLNYCMSKAPEFQIKTLLGFIFAHNSPSLKLFMDAGFQEWAYLPDVAVLDGQERGLKILGKRLTK